MLLINVEKNDAPNSTPVNAVIRKNTNDATVPNSYTNHIANTEKLSFFQKVCKNLNDYERWWFTIMFIFDIIAVAGYTILTGNIFPLVTSFGTLILTFISFVGISNSMIGLFPLNFIVTLLLVICFLLIYSGHVIYGIELTLIFEPACCVRIVFGFSQLLHACLATIEYKS
ncbi:hypothetical protein ENBRE01_1623 [Enteropsectra breve]|nr:hypothetical protein ENBRE01_1623 [Enteropsectra breve]